MRNAIRSLLFGIGLVPAPQAAEVTLEKHAGDVNAYMTLWNENFVGWPASRRNWRSRTIRLARV
jgi:hypothetical protein